MRWHFFCLVSACLSSSAFAQQQQFREWTFEVPAGWQFTTPNDSALLTPSNARPGSVYIKLFPEQTISGDLQSWLEAQATQDSQGLPMLRNMPVGRAQTANTSALQKMIAVQLNNGEKAVRMYVGQSPSPGRGALLLFHAEVSVAGAYTPVLNRFIDSIRFSGTQAALPPPVVRNPNSGSSLNGWYVGSHQRFVPGPNFTFTYKLVWDYYRFFPDGWVYTSFPQSSLDSISCPQSGTGEGKCEQYTIQGKTIAIGRSRPSSFEIIPPDEIKISGNPAWPLRPIQNVPSGTYQAVNGSGIMGTASLSVKEITFLSDGTFHSAGSTGVISVSQGGGSTASAAAHRQAEGAGNYRVNGFELELKYNNGQAVKERILAPSDNDMGLLVIGSNNYVKKDGK